MSLEQLREKFESWISSPPFELNVNRWPNDETKYAWPNQYQNTEVELAWQAWNEGYELKKLCPL